ncbi:MAG: PTS sugar transporter subunit IIA [Candidatus Cloacimonadales bacterium]|nr:PTS sugar transporter subunit IIA [Candidatus Cloacimonadales bacterium]
MTLEKMLLENCIDIKQSVPDKKSVLKIIAALAIKNPILQKYSEEQIYKSLQTREELGSTGFSNQIAIPHCAVEGISDFVLGILIVTDGVDFDSLDKKPAKIFVFIIAPASQKTQHLRILSTISNYLRNQDNINKLLLATSPLAIRETFLRHTLDKEELEKQNVYQLFQVVVQDDEKYEQDFEEILDIFTGIEDCNFYITEAENASKYLYKMPLFSMFWHENQPQQNRVITAIVRKSNVNDTAKKLNQIIKKSKDHPGLLYFVQDIYYLNGSLNI